MKALVTGAAGFLGSHIVDALLARGFEVVVFDRRLRNKCLSDLVLDQVERVEADVLNLDALLASVHDCSLIFHCAAFVGVNAYSEWPARTMDVEAVGLSNICKAALAVSARVIYPSSSAVYGLLGGNFSAGENYPATPVSNYGVAKRFNEFYLQAQYIENGLSSVSLRIFNMYGPRQDNRLVVPRFIFDAISGKDLEVYGNGNQTRDFIYIDDVVYAALACALSNHNNLVVDVASGIEVSMIEIAGRILKLTGSNAKIVKKSMPKERINFEVTKSVGKRAKLEQIIGQKDMVSLDEGLMRTISFLNAGRRC